METQPLSVQHVVHKAKSWLAYLIKRWQVLLLCIAIGAFAGCLYAYFTKPIYTARLTFVLYNDNKLSSLSGLAGQLGLSLGTTENSPFDGDNIIQLLKSQRILLPVLFRPVKNVDISLIDKIAEVEGLQKKWQRDTRLKKALPFGADESALTPLQDSLKAEICDFVVKKYLFIDKVDKKLSYYQVTSTTKDPDISCCLTNYLVAEASRFYIDTKTQLARQNLAMVSHEADSLRRLLAGSIVGNASETDKTFNLNPAYQVNRAGLQEGQVKISIVEAAYAEVVRNLEIAKITVQKETPLYQVIDTPIMPLKKIKPGLLACAFIGAAVAGFAAIMWLLFVKFYKGL